MNWRSPSATKVLGAAGLILVGAGGWLLALGPQTSALAEVATGIRDTRERSDLLRDQLSQLRAQEKSLPQLRRSARVLAATFPPTADQPGLFRAVTDAATAAGIRAEDVTALTPTPPVVGVTDEAAGVQLPAQSTDTDVAAQTVSLSVDGTFDQTQQLLANLEEMPRAYLITGLTLALGSEAQTFTATITGQMFIMPPAVDPADAPKR